MHEWVAKYNSIQINLENVLRSITWLTIVLSDYVGHSQIL
jgi:hypothetical protein